MQIFNTLDNFNRLKNAIVTIGTFDGVHLGHQKILQRIIQLGLRNNAATCILTFNPHPRKVLFPNQASLFLLSSVEEKKQLLSKAGIDNLVIVPFTIDFSKMSHQYFVEEILINKIGAKTIVVGYDHQFGHNRAGNFKELKELSIKNNFIVEEISKQDIDDIAVSSTRIRNAISNGEIKLANQLLGYSYQLSGTVVKGNQIGRTIGFPTANLKPSDDDKLIPAIGVYAAKIKIDNNTFKSVLSIGNRPTFDNGALSIEAHIFDFNRDIYGKNVDFIFEDYIRSELKFNNVDDLVVRMKQDSAIALELLA